MKNIPCEVVQDLLPLYQDDACSEASRALVEEHLRTCSVCSGVQEVMAEPIDTPTVPENEPKAIEAAAKGMMDARQKTVLKAAILAICAFILLALIAWGVGSYLRGYWYQDAMAVTVPADEITVLYADRDVNGRLGYSIGTDVGSYSYNFNMRLDEDDPTTLIVLLYHSRKEVKYSGGQLVTGPGPYTQDGGILDSESEDGRTYTFKNLSYVWTDDDVENTLSDMGDENLTITRIVYQDDKGNELVIYDGN
jgi:hypothetical protein